MKCRHELVCRDPEPLRRDGGVGGVRVVSHQRSRYRLVIGDLQRRHHPSHHLVARAFGYSGGALGNAADQVEERRTAQRPRRAGWLDEAAAPVPKW